jgi:hypothetical protein
MKERISTAARALRPHLPTIILFVAIFATAAYLRYRSLGYGLDRFLQEAGQPYLWSLHPAQNLLDGQGLVQLYPTFPKPLPVLMYPPGLPVAIAVVKFFFRHINDMLGMLPALASVAFFFAFLGVLATAWSRRDTTFARVWLERPADGALPSLLPLSIALAAFPPLIAFDLVPLGGAFSGALVLVGVFFLVRAQVLQEWWALAVAGLALGFATWFRMETFPVTVLLVATFAIANAVRRRLGAVRVVVVSFVLPVFILASYNHRIYGRFTAFPSAAHGLFAVLETCSTNTMASDATEAQENWTGTFGGYYFPDQVSVGKNIMQRATRRLFGTIGVVKYLECGGNRLTGWLENVESAVDTELRHAAGIRFSPFSLTFLLMSMAGLIAAGIRRPAALYLPLTVVYAFLVQAFLAPWFAMHHISYIIPMLLTGCVLLVLTIIEDLPWIVSGRRLLSSRVSAIIATVPALGMVVCSAAAGLGSPLDLSHRARYELADYRGSVSKGDPLPVHEATPGSALVVNLQSFAAPAGSSLEIQDDTFPQITQYRLPVRSRVGTFLLPSWMPRGKYTLFLAANGARQKVGGFEVTAANDDVNLATGRKIFLVPPPSWKDGGVSPAQLLAPDLDGAKQNGSISASVGWLFTPEVLAYVDLGEQRQHIHSIVAHGAYGSWSALDPPDDAEFAVSDDGLRWSVLPRPRLYEPEAESPSTFFAFHIGVEHVDVSGRYVRLRVLTNAVSGRGAPVDGLARVTPGHLFISGIEVLGSGAD